jgi:hypothetical protein
VLNRLGSLNTYVDGEKVTSMSPNGIAFSGKTIWFGTRGFTDQQELKRLVTIQAYWMSLHFGIALDQAVFT